MGKRFFTMLLVCLSVLPGLGGQVRAADLKANFRVETDPTRARIPVLSWDSEGGDRARVNLLRAGTGVGLRIRLRGDWQEAEKLETEVEKVSPTETRYRVTIARDAKLEWRIHAGDAELTMWFNATVSGLMEGLEVRFPFDPRVAATTLLPSAWD